MKGGLDYWEWFAAEAAASNAPLYVQFAKGVGGDEALREIANGCRKGQPPANILFAAVHFLLLRGAGHPLRGYYRNLGGSETGDAFAAFRDFVLAHRAALRPLIATRVTNTNEVARSILLQPAFRVLAQEAGEPLHLIEIGPSAGLNMIWDRYGAFYRRGGEVFPSGAPGAALVVECEARGETRPPLGAPPSIASRIGLERDPVDLADPDARDWLKALVWPDHVARFARLEQALALERADACEIRAGDALDLLPEALAEAPPGETLCVYHTMVVYQFSHEMREALEAMLVMAGLRRPVYRLSIEDGLLSQALGLGAAPHRPGEGAILLSRYRDGHKQTRELARCHPQGGWIEWRG